MRTFLGGIFLGPFSSSLQEFFAVYSIFTELIVDVFCIERFLGKKLLTGQRRHLVDLQHLVLRILIESITKEFEYSSMVSIPLF